MQAIHHQSSYSFDLRFLRGIVLYIFHFKINTLLCYTVVSVLAFGIGIARGQYYCCLFLVSTQPLLPVVSALLCPQFGTHSLLTFVLVLRHILSVVFLKPTFSNRPTVLPSRSHKCLRFGLWSILRTINILFTNLLTYLLDIGYWVPCLVSF